MAYPTAAGTPSMTGTYIPEIWSSKLIKYLYESTCLNAITNTDYEGEIKDKGDKVHINQLPDTDIIHDYVEGQDLSYDNPTVVDLEMLIDKGKYWAFPAGDVSKKQSDVEYVNKWADHYSRKLKIAVETDVFANVYSDADASNIGLTAGNDSGDINLGTAGTPRAITKDNVLDVLVDIGVVLDEQSIDEDMRKIVIPPWFAGLIKKSDLKDASLTGDGTSVLRNGRIGMIDRLELFTSRLLTSGTDGIVTAYNVICAHKSAIAFAAQITKNETLRNPNSFGDLVRMLHVYGYKVVQPKGLVNLYCYKG